MSDLKDYQDMGLSKMCLLLKKAREVAQVEWNQISKSMDRKTGIWISSAGVHE
jgi:hypothetical protein